MPIYVPKNFPAFTGDTNTLDWQIGFEDNKFNFLGLGNKKEQKARQQAMNDMRAIYGTPTSCDMVTTGIPKIQQHLADTQAQIDNGSSPNVAPRYLDALNTILAEYIAYSNSNCIVQTGPPATVPPAGTTSPGTSTGTGLPSANTDPILQTALPGNTSPTISGQAATQSTAAATAQTALTNAANTVKAAPKWVWIAGGGLLLLIGIIAIAKKKA